MRRAPDFLEEGAYDSHHPWVTLWRLTSGMRWRIVGVLGLFVVKHSPVWVMPIATANVINAVTSGGPGAKRSVIINAIVMLATIGQNFFTSYFSVRFQSGVIRSLEVRLRSALVLRMQQLSIGFHEGFHSGRMHAKILRDVELVANLVEQLVNSVFLAICGGIVTAAVTLQRQPLIALFFVATIPIVAVLRAAFKGRMRDADHRYRVEIEEMSSQVAEMVEMIPVTRAHGAEDFEINRMQERLEDVRKKGVVSDTIRGVFSASSWVISQSARVICLVFSAWLAFRGLLRVGDVVMFNQLFMMIVKDVSGLLNVYPMMARGVEAIRSMGDILGSPDLEHNEGKSLVTVVKGAIRFEHVRFSYPGYEKAAIRDLSFGVAEGETVAFVGESGSGKSTVMSLVMGFHRPGSGKIYLDGTDMELLDLRSYRRCISVVSQNTILFSGSVRDNITYGMQSVSEQRLQEAVAMARADEFICQLPHGLDTIIGEHGARLSGGQRQRLAIARALIRDPAILIFDEATSALDAVSERMVQEAVDNLIQGRTTFIVAHRLSTIRNADRIFVMKNGVCVEHGAHNELMCREGEFYKLLQYQQWTAPVPVV